MARGDAAPSFAQGGARRAQEVEGHAFNDSATFYVQRAGRLRFATWVNMINFLQVRTCT